MGDFAGREALRRATAAFNPVYPEVQARTNRAPEVVVVSRVEN
jgi:hypothetical protein